MNSIVNFFLILKNSDLYHTKQIFAIEKYEFKIFLSKYPRISLKNIHNTSKVTWIFLNILSEGSTSYSNKKKKQDTLVNDDITFEIIKEKNK